MVEEFRIHEKGIGNDTRTGCPTHCRRPRVPEGEKNDPGYEQPHGSPFSRRESHGGETAKRIQRRLGSLDHWILCDLTASQNLGRVRSIRPWSSESNHHGRIGLRGDVAEVIFAGNPSVSAARSGIETNVDTGGGYKIGDAV